MATRRDVAADETTPPPPRPRRAVLDFGPTLNDRVLAGRRVIEAEIAALQALVSRIDLNFAKAVEMILACKGMLVVTGMGKPGFVAQKISATFASTGTPSLYLHPAEALHGDLGRITRRDVVLLLSNSGRTEEMIRLMDPIARIGAKTILMTGDVDSPLAERADLVLDIGKVEEACPLGLAPTASSTVLLVLGDALAMAVMECRDFGPEDWALYHPAGALGARVMRVREVMRTGEANPVVREDEPLSRAVAVMTQTPGRPGATNVVDRRGKLVGIFTDGDLRRLFEKGEADPARPVGEVMGRDPTTVVDTMLVTEAARVLRDRHVDQVPVLDSRGRLVGLLDVQDLLDLRVL